jgi:tetratricopeptide (TPR) repeat protein
MKKILLFVWVVATIVACSETEQSAEETSVSQEVVKKEDPYAAINAQIKADPSNIKLYIERGRIAVEQNNVDLALADLERAKSIDSLNADVWVYAGQLNYIGGGLDLAKANYLRAISFDKSNKDALTELAKLNFQLRDLKEAYKYANDAIRADEQYYLPYYIKGIVLLASGDTAKAVSAMQTSLELNPDFYEGYMHVGALYDEAQKDIALDYYSSAISTNPTNPEGYYYKALYFQNSERLEEAYEVYNEILNIDSTFTFAYYNQGFICLEYLGDFEIGAERFSLAIKYNPDYYDAYYNRGLCYENLKQYTKAESDYKLALSIKPDYDLAAIGLSRVLDK